MKKGAIAILGGMGPEASAKMLEVMVDMAANDFGAKDGTDFPEIILFSLPVPDFISDKRKIGIAKSILEDKVKLLNNMDASCAVLACNTAHIMIDDLQAVSNVQFISMIEAVADEVERQSIGTVGLLATPSSINAGLFQRAFSKRKIKVILPSNAQMKELEVVIRRVIAKKASDQDEKIVLSIAKNLVERGAKGVILGCTELPLIFPKSFPLPIFDSIVITCRVLLIKAFDSEKKGFTIN
ncbi:MAG TPA: amino acid racemase [Patescibacteria group bacterium]|nr:amino acid racemase [Patescibacteria group bacterium]